jgi:hypothetical protein
MKEVRAYIFGLVDGVLIGVGCVDIVFAWLVARGKINLKMLDPKYVRDNYIYKPHYERTRDPFWSSTYRDKWRQYHYRHPNPYATCDHCVHEMRDKEIYPCRVCFDHDHFMHAADSDVPNTLFDMPCSECAKWNDGKRDEMCALCRTSPSGVKLYFEEKEAEAVEEYVPKSKVEKPLEDHCYRCKYFENDLSESPCEDCKWAFPYGDVTHEDHFEPDEED